MISETSSQADENKALTVTYVTHANAEDLSIRPLFLDGTLINLSNSLEIHCTTQGRDTRIPIQAWQANIYLCLVWLSLISAVTPNTEIGEQLCKRWHGGKSKIQAKPEE